MSLNHTLQIVHTLQTVLILPIVPIVPIHLIHLIHLIHPCRPYRTRIFRNKGLLSSRNLDRRTVQDLHGKLLNTRYLRMQK